MMSLALISQAVSTVNFTARYSCIERTTLDVSFSSLPDTFYTRILPDMELQCSRYVNSTTGKIAVVIKWRVMGESAAGRPIREFIAQYKLVVAKYEVAIPPLLKGGVWKGQVPAKVIVR